MITVSTSPIRNRARVVRAWLLPIVTAGSGWAQRAGGPIEEIHPGDVIWFAPNGRHWHGATLITAMTQIAIQDKKDDKLVDWIEHVSE